MFLNLGSEISEILLFLYFKENPDCFVFHFATWFFSARTMFVPRVSPFLCVWKRTELATNFLHKSDKLVFGPLILFAPEWTVVTIALFPMVSSSSSASHKYEGSVSLSPDSSWKIISSSLRVVELVKDVGLITCGRIVYRHGARLLSWRRRRENCLGVVLMEGGVQVRVQVEVGREEQGESQNEEQTQQSTAHHGWHEYGVTRGCRHLSQCSVMCIKWIVQTAWEKWRERCICLHQSFLFLSPLVLSCRRTWAKFALPPNRVSACPLSRWELSRSLVLDFLAGVSNSSGFPAGMFLMFPCVNKCPPSLPSSSLALSQFELIIPYRTKSPADLLRDISLRNSHLELPIHEVPVSSRRPSSTCYREDTRESGFNVAAVIKCSCLLWCWNGMTYFLYDMSEKLITELSDEIFGVNTINWEDSSWKYLTLVGDEDVISLLHTKVYVFSDSVLCFGKMNENTQSNKCMGRQIDVVQKFTRIQSFRQNWWWNRWNSSEISSQDSPRCRSATKFKSYCWDWVKQPENFTVRIIFMSMFNDISWGSKDNEKRMRIKCSARFSLCEKIFTRTMVFSSDLDQKRNGILLTNTIHKESGTEVRSRWC